MRNEWDKYWTNNSKTYTYIAHIYRILIMKPFSHRILSNYITPSSNVLHAGCGTGEVDKGLKEIYAIDYSEEAVKKYKYNNPLNKVSVMDIRAMKFNSNFFDVIYNLGVMEHYSEQEINRILLEFNRVLRTKGKIILFWPPTFGVTVRILNVINRLFKKRFHPEEITLLKSKEHARKMLGLSGFKLIKFVFCVRDIWTQCVVIGEKK